MAEILVYRRGSYGDIDLFTLRAVRERGRMKQCGVLPRDEYWCATGAYFDSGRMRKIDASTGGY